MTIIASFFKNNRKIYDFNSPYRIIPHSLFWISQLAQQIIKVKEALKMKNKNNKRNNQPQNNKNIPEMQNVNNMPEKQNTNDPQNSKAKNKNYNNPQYWNAAAIFGLGEAIDSTDPFGSYTGVPLNPFETPEQDADDL